MTETSPAEFSVGLSIFLLSFLGLALWHSRQPIKYKKFYNSLRRESPIVAAFKFK